MKNENFCINFICIFLIFFGYFGWFVAEQDNEILREQLSSQTGQEVRK
ncbi:hypothetical protein EC844_12644 [Acinetobacter calcoaceticus]|uniref:Uncharacterized protein n=1 Tax=Acinetobacter calcoaceticus TaxID=471 RepID=A0A4R1XIL4_ACICA|nr:hypothetical protein EC844_12644 [Acinetobacter calcoaceticus]